MSHNADKGFSVLTIALVIVVGILLVVIGLLINRIGPLPPGPPAPLPEVEPPAHAGDLKKIRGTVTGYQHNQHLDINSVQIQKDGDGLLSFEFRPHTASLVLSIAQIGNEVEIGYNTRPNDEAIGYHLHTVRDIRSGKQVNVDQLPPPPRIPPGKLAQTFTVIKPEVIKDSYGGIDGLQSNGKLFHFKPEQVEDIQALIKNGHNFSLLAINRGDQGFINIHNDEVYLVISITIDNKTFMIR
ncbi:hypothetical protein KTO58_14170 [Chitinophaga pendula]|uniref:hypothetical protein n=1 Tax=Chitinophaga TaxID=79328 RepID=UPI000BAE81EB|nr:MULTISPECIES: hypothetical protein [Chitinophaga]ASZ12113.1 hypothetical protein CK934_14665 [Chitinophaga sp. MD30]UCJ04850.1 hypothetical protein KTO58_14170 [Chitinophaga pendula]